MAFQVSDFQDLICLLQEHPEWQAQLRNILLSEDVWALPRVVRQIAEQVAQLTASVNELTARVNELAVRTDQRLAAIEARLDGLERRADLADRRFEEIDRRFEEIEPRLELIERCIDAIEIRLARLERDVADLKGWRFEVNYEKNYPSYFGKLLRRTTLIPKNLPADALDQFLDDKKLDEALRIDFVVKGKVKKIEPDPPEIYLAVEVSSAIYPSDVEQAVRRSHLIGKTGKPTIEPSIYQLASAPKVVLALDGQVSFWREALVEHGGIVSQVEV